MSSGPSAVVGVTGASGYLGGSLAALLRSRGHQVVEFRRTDGTREVTGDVRPLELGEPIPTGSFDGLDSLVVAAWDLRETNAARAWAKNVEGSRRIVTSALDAGVKRIVFVSSMSAYFGTRQEYGLMKLAVERTVLEAGHVAVRPGLVYGGASGGMTLTLSRLARLPVIPVFPGARLFTAHVSDVVGAMATLAILDQPLSGVVGLAEATRVPFRTIMGEIARATDSSAHTIAVPWQPLLAALRFAEKIGVPLPVRSDSLLGLVRPATTLPGGDVLERLGLSFRPFPEGLDGSLTPS